MHRESNNKGKLYPSFRIKADAEKVLKNFEDDLGEKRGVISEC